VKVPFLLFIIALIIRLAAVLFWQFDGLYGQDAFAYYQQALDIIQNVPAGKPPPTDFFWPNGYPLLITGFMLVVGSKPLAGQLAALSAGAALAPLVYWLARDLWESDVNIEPTDNQLTTRNDQVGFLAGLIVAVAGQPILSSVVIMADIPALFWATLAAWSVVRGLRSALFEAKAESNPHALESDPAISQQTVLAGLNLAAGAWFTAAGAALGLAIITRWIYILVVPALGFYTLFKIVSHRRSGWLPTPAILSGLVVLLPQLWLSLNKPESLLHNWLLGWQPVNFFQRRFETADGLASYRLPMAVFYAQPAGHPAYIFPILGLAALWSIWRLWQTKSWGALILLLGWAGPVYLFLAGIPFQNFRFGLSLYVPLVVLTGFGVSELLGRAGGAQRSRGAGAQRGRGTPAEGQKRGGAKEWVYVEFVKGYYCTFFGGYVGVGLPHGGQFSDGS
jgi:4-amino-4-deoxy-L-arabinose transferase-like glycosyltransferase